MSLINQMLRDLESRRPAPAAAGNAASLALAAERAGAPAVPAPAPARHQPWLIGGLLLIAVLLALLLVMQKEKDSGLRSEDSVAASSSPVAQPPEPVPSSTQLSALSTEHSVAVSPMPVAQPRTQLPEPSNPPLSTQHSALSTTTDSSVSSPARTAKPPAQKPASPRAPAPARVKTLRLRSLDGVTRILVDLDRRAVHHTALDGERFSLTLSGVNGRLPQLPSLTGTPLADLDSRFADGQLHLAFRFDTPQQLRGSELRDTADGVRLVVTLAALHPTATESRPAATPVSKQVRPLDETQRAEQALRRGVGLLGQGRQAEAELALREAVDLDPRLARAREALAAMHLNDGRISEARNLLADGLRLAPGEAGLARLYARLLAERGELAPALIALQRARPPLADDPDYHALLAALYQRAGQHEPAAWTYRQLLARDGGRAAWWMGLAISLEALGEPAAALDAYVKAHQLGAGLSAEVLDYVSGRIRALAPSVAAARQAAGNTDPNEE